MRILFFATYPTQPTGYGRIGNILTNSLAAAGHEVHYLGISNFKNSAIERDIHPFIQLIDALEERKEGSNEMYGVDIICDQISHIFTYEKARSVCANLRLTYNSQIC